MRILHLLADKNSPGDQWLRENPLVLCGLMGGIALALLYFGIAGLRSGSAVDKYGKTYFGLSSHIINWARVAGGIFFLGASVYIAIKGP